MALGVQNYNGGTTDEYGTLLAVDRQMQSGVVEGLLVAANATPNMTVYVQPGSGLIPTGTYPSSYNYRFHIDTASPGASVTIGTAAASARIDYIVAYVDKSVAGSTAGANVNNTNAVLKLADVQGTPAGSPSVPTLAQIQSTIGASNPYIILAQIAVGASVSTITSTNITDLRTFASDRNDTALGASSYVDNGGVLSYTASTLNGNITSGLAYINVGGVMVPQSFNALSYTVTASKDTYFYVQIGNSTVQSANVSNGAASPALPANAVWIGKAISGASAISSVQQSGLDSNSKVLYPTNTIIGAQQAWQTASLSTGWAGFDAGGPGNFGFPQYMKDSLGYVHLRGLVKNSTGANNTSSTNALVFTLPAGYRPGMTMRMPVINSDTFGDLDIKNDGTVIIASTMTVTSGGWIGLNNLHFRAEA